MFNHKKQFLKRSNVQTFNMITLPIPNNHLMKTILNKELYNTHKKQIAPKITP